MCGARWRCPTSEWYSSTAAAARKCGTPLAPDSRGTLDGKEAHRAAELTERAPALLQPFLARVKKDIKPRFLHERDQVHVVPGGNASQQMIAAQMHADFGGYARCVMPTGFAWPPSDESAGQ